MRILHLSKFYPPHRGGIERYVELLARAQAKAGLSVAVLAHGTPRKPRPSRVRREAGVLLAESRTPLELVFTPISPSWPFRLGALLSRFRPDVLHLHLPNPWAFALLLLPAARRRPWLAHWHADVPDGSGGLAMRLALPFYRRLEQALLKRCSRIIATSASYAASSRQLRRHAERVEVIPLAVAPPAPGAAAPAWPAPGLRLLAVGRLTYYKGLPLLLEAMTRCRDCSLLLVGEGEQRGLIEAQVKRLGLSDRVQLAGNLPDDALDAAYREADVICLASLDRAEAFGLVLLEAMRAGKPCIASRVRGSGMSEVVQDGVNGLLVKPGSVEQLAAAIDTLRDDPALRQRLGEAGWRRWDAEYRIESGIERLNALYRQLQARGAAPAPSAPPPPAPPAAGRD